MFTKRLPYYGDRPRWYYFALASCTSSHSHPIDRSKYDVILTPTNEYQNDKSYSLQFLSLDEYEIYNAAVSLLTVNISLILLTAFACYQHFRRLTLPWNLLMILGGQASTMLSTAAVLWRMSILATGQVSSMSSVAEFLGSLLWMASAAFILPATLLTIRGWPWSVPSLQKSTRVTISIVTTGYTMMRGWVIAFNSSIGVLERNDAVFFHENPLYGWVGFFLIAGSIVVTLLSFNFSNPTVCFQTSRYNFIIPSITFIGLLVWLWSPILSSLLTATENVCSRAPNLFFADTASSLLLQFIIVALLFPCKSMVEILAARESIRRNNMELRRS